LLRIRTKSIAGEAWQPKTKVNRAVPISWAFRGYLDRYAMHPSDRGWLFPSPDDKRWDPANFAQELRTANAETGLHGPCLDFHHTSGSQLAQAGVGLFKVASLSGNSSAICPRHYAALSHEHLAVDVEFGTAVQPPSVTTSILG
jgi:integrase